MTLSIRKENRLQNSQTKKRKLITVLVVLIFLVVCSVSFFLVKSHINQKNAEISKQTEMSLAKEEGKNVREAMSAMSNLYEDSSKLTLKPGLKKSDLNSVKESIDKLEDGKLKTELINQLNKIQSKIK